MRTQAIADGRKADGFTRVHRLFVEHMGYAVGFVWLACLTSALYAPWLRNIRGLINPLGRQESTASFLFTLPVLMTVAWVCVAFGENAMRRSQVLKSHVAEFVFAGAVSFAVFCLAIGRAVTAFQLG